MMLPSSYGATLILLIFSMLCWGSWANTQKAAGRWRFELFYFDYSIGVLITSLLLALTFGMLGDDLSFEDNLAITGKTQILMAVAAGAIFNLANMLLVAAIALSGMAIAFPISIGLALVIGVILNYIVQPQGNPFLLFTGAALVVAAIVVDAIVHRRHALTIQKRGGRKVSRLGLLISLGSGVLMGVFYPLVEKSKEGDIGLGPYSAGFFFAVGVFLSTFPYNFYFMNLPVQGEPVGILSYFKGSRREHLLGLAGGCIWCAGTIANFVAASAPKTVNVGPAISYALGQGATLISALWGIFYWREFAGAIPSVNRLLLVMLLLFIAGLTIVSIAPLY